MDIKQHIKDRHIDFDLHRPAIDELEQIATFYLWNLSGQLVGYQQYRPSAGKDKKNNPKEGRYFTYRLKSTVGMWGLESLHFCSDILFVTEGIFDAARLTEMGMPAVAVLSNNPSQDTRNTLTSMNRHIIAVCDPGKAGRKLAKVGNTVIFTPDDKDLGDASEDYVRELIKSVI